MITKKDKNQLRLKRHLRVRKNIFGTAECPRLNVYRSTNHIYAQVIDDVTGNTLVAANTLQADIKGKLDELTKVQQAELVGKTLAEKAAEKGITKVVFDRGGYLYTGRVAALADGARKAGLQF